jgi:2-succinyl-6-hydroxy-2,4-cyclohexadiene-1-carboxylate synthase
VTTGWTALAGPLAAERLGHGPRMVFAHGFTQTGESWKPIAEYFAGTGHESVVVDLPGHGGSGSVRADVRRGADMLAAFGPATYVGYSMGGRFCLHVALAYPHIVRGLAIIGANPGIDDADARAERRADDERMANRLRAIGVDAFLEEWTAQPVFGGYRPTDEELADRRRNSAEGLVSSLRLAGTGSQSSLWPRLWEIGTTVLAMAGAADTKFVAIGQQLARAVRNGRFVSIADAGHAAHLQQPALVAAAIADWLGR